MEAFPDYSEIAHTLVRTTVKFVNMLSTVVRSCQHFVNKLLIFALMSVLVSPFEESNFDACGILDEEIKSYHGDIHP